ncbi:hypothetical protein ACFY05_06700 [Microtetraspora fusca]|uniref:Type IV secretion system protein n=1 Tax=Microtetraspora fusca TaxID=1997 RepID=A0ABW6UZP7_MICFU
MLTAAPATAAAPTPSPTPSPIELPAPPTTSGGIGFGLGGWISNQINSWFADLVTSAIRPLLNVLAVTLLHTPSVEGQARIQDLWQAVAILANGAFVVLMVVAGMLVMGHETVQTRYALKEIAPRLVVAFLAANFSFFLASQAIELANGVSAALLGQGFDARRAANVIRVMIVPPGHSQIFYILLALVSVILLVLLLVTFVFRVAMTTLLVIAGPLALACLALPQTGGLARLWWRGFSGLLIIQVAQSLTLVTAVRIFFNQDGREAVGLFGTGPLYNLLLVLCLLLILVRIPGWVSRAVFVHHGRGSAIGRIVKYAVAYKLTSPVLNALHLGRGGKAVKAAGARAAVGKALPALAAGPAGTAAAGAATAATAARRGAVPATAASAARGGTGPAKHAPVSARRPVRADDWEAAPVKHAPSAPAIRGKYRPTPQPSRPVPPNTPVYGYPRETYYANGPAGLAQMYRLRDQSTGASAPHRATERPIRPVRPIVSPDAPVPGTPAWPENPGVARRTPPPSRRRTRRDRKKGDER